MENTAAQLGIEMQESNRLAHRDRNISISAAHRAIADSDYSEFNEDNFRAALHDIAMKAAYLAIQGDREMHQHEMKYLDNVMDMHLQEMSMRPPSQIIFPMSEDSTLPLHQPT